MVLLRLLALAALGSACVAGPTPVTTREGAIVYGTDDRVELFEVPDPQAQAVIAGAAVALVPNDVIHSTDGVLARATTWGDADQLCDGEPFAGQPSAAFCSGVLVDWDLVLPAQGGRIALGSGTTQTGWLDVWGNGASASLESRRALSDLARLLAILLAGRGRSAAHPALGA